MSSNLDLNKIYQNDNCNYAKVAHSILNISHRGLEGEETFLDKSLNCISNAENLILQNSTFDKTSNEQLPYCFRKNFCTCSLW